MPRQDSRSLGLTSIHNPITPTSFIKETFSTLSGGVSMPYTPLPPVKPTPWLVETGAGMVTFTPILLPKPEKNSSALVLPGSLKMCRGHQFEGTTYYAAVCSTCESLDIDFLKYRGDLYHGKGQNAITTQITSQWLGTEHHNGCASPESKKDSIQTSQLMKNEK